MLSDYIDDLEEAWTTAGESPLVISISAKIAVSKGKNICEISLSFTKEKVKETLTYEWNPNQRSLFEHIKNMDEKLKKDGVTMEISSKGKSVTLGKTGHDS